MVNCIEQLGVERTLHEACGMFALAVFDKEKQRVILARDRSGQKPLYYSLHNHRLSFASELKAMRVNETWRDEIDVDNLALFARHNYVPAPYSIYKNTYKLLAGTYICFDIDNSTGAIKNLDGFSPFTHQSELSPQAFWQLKDHISEQRKEFSNVEGAIDQLDNILGEVVGEQMISDVPLGAFLSGGVDSSAVVALMQKLSSKKVKTFSIGFTDNDYNEAPFAKSVADHLGNGSY